MDFIGLINKQSDAIERNNEREKEAFGQIGSFTGTIKVVLTMDSIDEIKALLKDRMNEYEEWHQEFFHGNK